MYNLLIIHCNSKLNEYTIGPHGPRFLDVYIENHGETAYSPNVVVNVSFSNPTLSNSFIIRPTLDGNHKCYLNNNKVVCRDPLHKGQKVIYMVIHSYHHLHY